MILRHAKIENYGKLQNREFGFSPGINVIYGENEAGKSTLQSFLKSMLFGLEKTRRRNAPDEYSRYEPWEAPAWFAGELEFSVDGKEFLLSRNFYRKEPSSRLTNLRDGEELSVEHGDLDMLLGGVGREAFEHTLAISGSGSDPGAALGRMVRDEMQNMAQTGDNSFRLSRGMAYLEQKKTEQNRRRRALQAERTRAAELLREKDRTLQERLDGLRERELGLQESGRESAAAAIGDSGEFRDENHPSGLINPLANGAEAAEDVRIRPQNSSHREEYFDDYDDPDDYDDSDDYDEAEDYDEPEDYGEPERPGGRKKWDPLVVIGVAGFFLTALIFDSHRLSGTPAALLLILFGVLITVGLLRLLVRRRNENREDGFDGPDGEDAQAETEERRREKERIRAERMEALRRQQALQERERARREAEMEHRIRMARNDGEREAILEQIRECETERSNLQEALRETGVPSEEEAEIEKSLQALDLAASVMQEQAKSGSRRMQKELEERTSEILEQMTAGRYARTAADADGAPVVSDQRREVSAASLSAGTADQLWFAWRMAAGEILCREEPLPFLLDEAFSSFDDRRLAGALEWLADQDRQILLFCCQHREEKMMERLGIPFRMIRL